MTDVLICESCDAFIGVYRKDNNTLEIACKCASRPIKTSEAFPESWT